MSVSSINLLISALSERSLCLSILFGPFTVAEGSTARGVLGGVLGLGLLGHAGMGGRHGAGGHSTRGVICIGISGWQGALKGMNEGVGGRQDMLEGLRRGSSVGLGLLGSGRGRLALASGTRRGSYGGRIVAETHLNLRLLLLGVLLLLGLVLLLGEFILLLLLLWLADIGRRTLVLKG